MDRRDFLKTVAITGAALTIQRSEAMEVLTQTINKANGSNPDLQDRSLHTISRP